MHKTDQINIGDEQRARPTVILALFNRATLTMISAQNRPFWRQSSSICLIRATKSIDNYMHDAYLFDRNDTENRLVRIKNTFKRICVNFTRVYQASGGSGSKSRFFVV